MTCWSSSPRSAFADNAQTFEEAGYKQLIDQALDEYSRGDWDEAKVLFARAHSLQPSARTLRGLALTAYELRDYVSSIGYGEAALASDERPLTEEMRVALERLLSQANHFAGRIILTLEPRTGIVLVDGRPARLAGDGGLLLNPGSHELVAQAPGYQATRRTVLAEGGEVLDIDLKLVGATPERQLAEKKPSAPARRQPKAVVGVSGVVAATGVVLLVLAARDTSKVEDAAIGTPWSDVEAANERAPKLAAVGYAALGAGAAGIASGIAWLFLRKRSDRLESATLRLAAPAARLHEGF